MNAGKNNNDEIMGRFHFLVLTTLLIIACLCAVVICREVFPTEGYKDRYLVKESPEYYFRYFCEAYQTECKTYELRR